MRRSTEPTSGANGPLKKKFGKNLNKLVKPAAPPIVSNSGAHNARNGLLLLSTKKAASKESAGPGLLSKQPPKEVTVAASPSNTSASATAATVSKPAYESKAASTHDVLLNAVKGALLEPQTPLDAWGVQQQQLEAAAASSEEHDNAAILPSEANSSESKEREASESPLIDTDTIGRAQFTHVAPSWDEYGGRDATAVASKRVSAVALPPKPVIAMIQKRPEGEAIAETKLNETEEAKAAASLAQESAKQIQQQDTMEAPRLDAAVAHATNVKTVESRQLWSPEPVAASNEAQPIGQKEANAKTLDVAYQMNGPTPLKHQGPQPPTPATSTQPVIYLASYEDRNRGEQDKQNQSTRMLYDPRSGSMVAVGTLGNGRKDVSAARGSRNSKPANAPKSNARRDKTKDSGSPALSSTKASFSNGGKDDMMDEKRHLLSKQSYGNSNLQPMSSVNNVHRPFPRTCGVLYSRDDEGNLYCVDGCEGDLGYGMHSVPGGRMENTAAYAEYKRKYHHSARVYKVSDDHGYERYTTTTAHARFGASKLLAKEANMSLYTGLTAADKDEEFISTPLEYVRADDKLELVTGDDDTPTLKPTARAWAPSQTAIAAAAAARVEGKNATNGNEQEMDDSGDDDDGPLGLGFDPTQGMDFELESPSHERRDTSRLGLITMSALSLEPSGFKTTDAEETDSGGVPRHLFGFGASGTWGVNTDASSSGASEWELPRTNDAASLFGGGIFQVQKDDNRDPSAAFITISSSNSWSAPSLATKNISTTPAGIE
ncbi:hypothetical protein MPSEU_000821800 [Mayamaea pseudoterrestris]|nr:hypothetical protein MPSEU_000821800 [Mayamaea pseudoterrestris]